MHSTLQRDGLAENPAGRDLWTVIAKDSKGLLSPARSSRGGREKHPHIVREMAAALASAAPAQGVDGQDMNVVIEMAQTRRKLSNYVDVNT